VRDERILIADDEPEMLALCLRVLTREGYRVCGVDNGSRAVERSQKEHYDVLVTDIRMPGMSGLQTYRTIRDHNPDIVGVAITGYGEAGTIIEALKLGMHDFLPKPFSASELTVAISRALERKTMARENARLKALLPLYQLSDDFMTVTDLDALLQRVLAVAVRETAADLGVVMLCDEASQRLEVRAVATDEGSEPPTADYRLAQDIAQQTMRHGSVIVCQAGTGQASFFAGQVLSSRVCSAAALPLTAQGESVGILALAKQNGQDALTRGDEELLSVLAGQAATAIQNARLFTRIRRAYEKLAALDHLKSEFIHIAAHEFRTPLAIVGSYIRLVEQDSSAEHGEYYGAIAAALDRLNSLTDDMTDLQFLQTGEAELRCREFSLPDLLAEAVEQFRPLAAHKDQLITVSCCDQLTYIAADRAKLQIILENLLANAVKFTPEGGTVALEAKAKEHGVHVTIRDTGIGIPEEEQEWIFKPFYQVESSLTRSHGGIGIGLTLAKSLVELYGGQIWVESEVGQGSAFHFTIPGCLRQSITSERAWSACEGTGHL
jgi:signal transduction histidine kinase/CheY-like chemotaxis protein